MLHAYFAQKTKEPYTILHHYLYLHTATIILWNMCFSLVSKTRVQRCHDSNTHKSKTIKHLSKYRNPHVSIRLLWLL